MNKLYRSMLLTSGLAAVLAGCGDDVIVTPPPPPPPPTVRSITVGPDGASVTVGATVKMTAAVNADAGVATTVAWTSSDLAKATVAADGTVLGIAVGSVGIKACSTVNTSVCGVATVNVVAAPVAIVTGVTVTPPAATLVIGQQITATATVQGTNSPSQAVTWSSLAQSIATVDANGVVTGVANGVAVIKATSNANSSVAGTLSVTVFTPQPATISIQSITTGGLNTPVNISNVNGQIEITLNVDNGAYTISRAQALVNGTTVIAEQTFASASANAAPEAVPSTIVLSLNTRQVVKLTNGAYVPVIFNGPNSITARIFVAGSTAPISSNSIPAVFKNQDAFTAGTTPVLTPLSFTPTFTTVGPTVWYKTDVKWAGGPNYVSFFPRTPAIAANSNFCGSSSANQTGTPQTGFTLGGQLACATAAAFEGAVAINGFSVTPGSTPAVPADVQYVAASNSTELVGSPYTVAATERYNLLSSGSFAFGNTVNIDTKGPSVSANEIGFLAGCSGTIPNPGCWIGSAYNIQSDFGATDGGTGVASKTITDYVTTVSSVVVCGTTPFSAAALAEDPSPVKYDACMLATDNIGNVSATIRGANQFGVDKTNPTIAYAGTYVSDSTVKTAVGAGNIDYAVNDNNAGLDANAVTLNLATLITDAAPACASGTIAAPIAAAAAGVNRQLTAPIASADNTCGDQGYYTWTASVADRAGNTTNAASPIVAAVDRTAPAIQAVAPQPLYRAGQDATLLVFATDSTDLAGVRLDVRYQATTAVGTSPVDLRYNITSGFGTVWDNVLTTITTPSTGFPATIPGSQVFGSFVIDTTVALGGPDSAFTQVQTTAFDFNKVVPNLSATSITPIPAVYKNNAFFPAVGALNPWALTGIQSGAFFSPSGACTYTYDTPTNGPTIPVQVLVANQSAPTVFEILFSIATTGNGLGVNDNPKQISDNGTFRRYRYTISSATCLSLGTPRLIAVKNGGGLPSAYLVP